MSGSRDAARPGRLLGVAGNQGLQFLCLGGTIVREIAEHRHQRTIFGFQIVGGFFETILAVDVDLNQILQPVDRLFGQIHCGGSHENFLI